MINLKNKNFFSFSKTADYLKLPSVALQICDDFVSFMKIFHKKGVFTLGKYGKEDLPEGVVRGGFVNDKEKLVSILRRIKKENNLKFVISALPEEKIYSFRATLPFLKKEKDIKKSIRVEIEKNLPIPLSDLEFDYRILNYDKKRIDVWVFVVSLKTISSYTDILKQSGFTTLALGFQPEAFCKAVSKKTDNQPFIAINLGKNKTNIHLINKGWIISSHAVAIGSNHLFSKIKGDSVKKVSAKIDLKNEIEKMFSYWKSINTKDSSLISKIVLSGDRVAEKEILNYFQENFDTEIDLANVWSNIFSFESYIPEILFEDSFAYSVPIGLNIIKTEEGATN